MKALVLCLVALPAFAGEYAVLSSGFRIHADRHEKAGDMIRLFSEQGVTEIPAVDVARFDEEEYTPPAPVQHGEGDSGEGRSRSRRVP